MRQVFDGWGVASKRKGRASDFDSELESYDILSAPVATDEYISCVEGTKAVAYHVQPQYYLFLLLSFLTHD